MSNKSCRAFEKKFHQIENETCTICGMSKREVNEEQHKHMLQCVRIAFHYDDPEYKQYGSKEGEPRNTPVTYANFLRMFQGTIPINPLDIPEWAW